MGLSRGVLRLVYADGLPVLRMLHLGEALYRADTGNWFLINNGKSGRHIVMGISGKAEELVDLERARSAGVRLIRRYSGGGTVVVDHNTVFASLIVSPEAAPDVQPFPEHIMRWSEGFYRPALGHLSLPDTAGTPGTPQQGSFHLRENDYVIGTRKFGGNAQAISKGRWVHHTSFLWDYDCDAMALLRHPRRTPKYRDGRDHEEFVCRLSSVMADRSQFVSSLKRLPGLAGWQVEEVGVEEAEGWVLGRRHLRSTREVEMLPGNRTREGASVIVGGGEPGT